jgi:hypothetical protein
MKDSRLCDHDGCEGIAIGAIVSKNPGNIGIIRYCEQHKIYGVISESWECIPLEKAVILEVMKS